MTSHRCRPCALEALAANRCARRQGNRASGYSLVELVVALVLGGIVLASAAVVFHGHLSLARAIDARAQNSEALRTASQVLGMETRWLHPHRDLRDFSADSLALRAIRGSGVVCHLNADGSVMVGLHEMRTPDPAKDSVLLLRDSTYEAAARLLRADTVGFNCGAAAHYRMMLSIPAQPGDAILIFEAGNYYLSQWALRYRLGSEGRQPLTNDAFDQAATFFVQTGSGGGVWLQARTANQRAERLHVRLPFLNQ